MESWTGNKTMKHFVVIDNAIRQDFALTNKIVAYIEQKAARQRSYEQCRGYIR